MTARLATKTPPFVLDDKRAIVKSLDHRGREQFGFGEARDVWVNFALVPLAGGLTDSVEMRFVGGAYWYRVEISRQEARDLLAQEPGTEEIRKMIDSRYSLEASPIPKSRLRCQYRTTGRRCDREAEEGWTTCKAHESKGGPREIPDTPEDDMDPNIMGNQIPKGEIGNG
jgi:hypothetical protein